MIHIYHQPHPALRAFVNNIMVFRLQLPGAVPAPVLSFPPLPEQCLYFYPFGAPVGEYPHLQKSVHLPRSIVVGPQATRIRLHMRQSNYTVKVGFQPGGLYRLLGIPMSEFPMDESLDSAYVLDAYTGSLADQLAETPDAADAIALVEQFLLQKLRLLRPALPIDRALPLLIRQGGLMNVDTMAHLACVSTRQLERQFMQRVGLGPKFFARLTRFASAWVLKENQQYLNWTTIAHQCGYFDQMHLIRDFKAFCGVSPRMIEEEFRQTPFLLKNRLPG
ncbi:AraC family transcriptional regulator [Emticicia sp. 21SJ11W-3]|uniref:helix-turn-helix domain-containing protein n=1 Tax=Emticicia sp. 21SJ11W-3 TaxID=2916755 RepID=UPI00209E579A|nr:helix-turn-helix domain-containing protein [Emticicia sp. 21SJ11W-3]UTA66531.1 helix-turn-helix domain-containing protein [Emticicia sp. 21SJ11W-3]